MTENVRPSTTQDLEARLADLAGAIDFPPTPDLATAVRSRLVAGAPRPLLIRRSMWRSVLLAAGLALVAAGGVLAVRVGLDLLHIRFGPVPTVMPSASPSSRVGPSPASSGLPGSSLGLGQAATLEDAEATASFAVLVPTSLGRPDVVYVGGPALREQVAFVYAPSDTLPPSGLLSGAGLLITQNRGEIDQGLASKLLDAHLATVEQVEVNGASGVWIAGQPHIFWYLAPDGGPIQESRRYVGDTLAWEVDGVLYRIEGDITLEHALEVAASMR